MLKSCWSSGLSVNHPSAGQTEATSVGHQRPDQNHTHTFQPSGTKRNQKKRQKKKNQLGDRNGESVGRCFPHQLVPKLQHVRAQPETTWLEGQQGRKGRGSEGGVLEENERRGVRLSSHTFQDSNSLHIYTHTHAQNKHFVFRKRL